MKPLIQENDYIVIEEGTKDKIYVVTRTEDLIYDYRSYGTVATVTLGSFTQVTDLEPKEIGAPQRRLYQVRAGIDIGMFYVEILAGSSRRGTFRVPKPTSSNYYVGYSDEESSPKEYPMFEFYLLYNEVPSFAVYNKYGFTITPYFSFRGKKIQMYDLEHNETIRKLKLSASRARTTIERIRENSIPHRKITMRGIEQ